MNTIFCLILIVTILIYLLRIVKNYYSYETFYASSCGNEDVFKAINAVSKDICEMDKKIANKKAETISYVKMYNWYAKKVNVPQISRLSSKQLSKDKIAAAKLILTDSKPETLGKSKSSAEAAAKKTINKNINSQTNQLSDEELRVKWVNMKTNEKLEEEYDNSNGFHRSTKNQFARISMQLTRKQMQIQLKNMQKRSFKGGVSDVKSGGLKDGPDTGETPAKVRNAIS